MMSEERHESALRAVLDLPELVEHIIFQLPSLDVLASATRVSHAWNHLIRTSPKIRKKLFLPTATSAPVFPAHFSHSSQFRHDCYPVYDANFTINPLFEHFRSYEVPQMKEAGYYKGELQMVPIDLASEEELLESKRSSWREMFITNPPCTTLFLESVTTLGCGSTFHTPTNLFNRRGITMGLLADILLELGVLPPQWAIERREYEGRIYDKRSSGGGE